MSWIREALLVAGAGIGLGLGSRSSDLLPRELGWVGNLGAVWLAVAFVVGSAMGSPKRAAIAGSATLTLAALVHYTSARLLRDGIAVDLLRFPVTQWIVIGTVTGAAFGALGSWWHVERRRALAVALLAAAFGAEALYLLVRGEPNAAVVAVPLEVLAALLLPLLLLRSSRERLRAAAWCALMTPAGAMVILGIVAAVRRVY